MPAANADPASRRPTGPTARADTTDALDAEDPLSPGDAPLRRVQLLLETTDTDPPAVGWIEPLLDRAIDLAGCDPEADHHLTLVLVDDQRMAELHERYTGVPGTTDVLTFDHSDDTGAETPVCGDIVICRDVAEREAHARGHDARTELLLYTVHGLLHLIGEDDHDPDAYRRMHDREDALLRKLGVGAVFATPTDASTGGGP